ncbi:helix-turn-helix domain-containing protein [Nostoc sp. NMS4]|uniref:helix-turn-helix domain-containing protein n=1 Tax=Nostoc sp. NMS4 TaxID=2815390 RepID=UPI0025F2AE63|nr:helix-turn-helix domain-containing protein [Nostoc sp. NMS4]MBN3926613.1 helix-turn-helix domain-containing protein [Nostoc sp. NMS4]
MTIKKSLVINQPEVGKLNPELRGLTGLAQEQFAASLGITYSTVNRWEKERVKPSSLAMQKIEGMLEEMGERGEKALAKYLSN